MRRLPWTTRWGVTTLVVVSSYLFFGAALMVDGIVVASGPAPTPPVQTVPVSPAVHVTPFLQWPPSNPLAVPQGASCPAAYLHALLFLFYSCGVAPSEAYAVNLANQGVAEANIATTLYNYLNITAAAVDNLNATTQELLSYYESRAEAIVPEFLNYTWNSTVADIVAIDSGLAPAIEGVAQVIAQQQYQAWNATAASWDAAFGAGGAFSGSTEDFVATPIPSGTHRFWTTNGHDFNVTQPFEWWAPPAYFGATGSTADTTYFNMEPGGTIVYANYLNQTPASPAKFTVFDVTKGTSFAVPSVTFSAWQNNSLPVESTIQSIGQFDLLKLVCTANCTASVTIGGEAIPTALVETSGSYAFNQNLTGSPFGFGGQPGVAYINTGVPELQINAPYTVNAGSYTANGIIPARGWGVCLTHGPGSCTTATVPMLGSVVPLGTGPGSVPPGANAMVAFGQTANSLYNNSMLMAYDYWLTLRAITLNGSINIPSNCAIPPPTAAFPVATDFTNYALSANNVEAIYLAYLNSIALEYNQTFTSSAAFCGNPNLGFSFNWTGSWALRLNITASLYFANSTTPLYLNGTKDVGASYANTATWPVRSVDPTLLYPTQYTLNVPVGVIFPVPVNNPLAAVLVNYPANIGYGSTAFKPAWGVPTYTSIFGNGNFSTVAGTVTSTTSGRPVAQADAIYVSSCVLNNVSENPCQISVTYFNAFVIGHIHAILPPVPVPSGGGAGLSALGNNCGFSALNQFYDGWAGYIGSAVANGFGYVAALAGGIPLVGGGIAFVINGIGCVVAWIIVILLFSLFAYVAVKVGVSIYRGARGQRRAPRENVS